MQPPAMFLGGWLSQSITAVSSEEASHVLTVVRIGILADQPSTTSIQAPTETCLIAGPLDLIAQSPLRVANAVNGTMDQSYAETCGTHSARIRNIAKMPSCPTGRT